MLVLSRGVNESIIIGDQIEVTVVSVKGDRVRVGIRAPRTVPVHRKEVYEEIQRANIAAAATGQEAAEKLGALFGSGQEKGKDKDPPPGE